MKKYIVTTCIGISILMSSCTEKEPKQKPNVLFIFADDQTFESISALNNSEIKTPNLDKLRSKGVTFTHTFNQGSWSPAVCMASRKMLITGQNIWKAQKFDKNKKKEESNDSTSVKGYWPEYMKKEGYDTYMAGKWHVNYPAEKVFDIVGTIRNGMPQQKESGYQRTFDESETGVWSPYDKSKGGYWKGGKHWSEVLGDEAIGFMEQAKNDEDPFFMYVAFNAPHDPRQSPKEYVDMYPLENIAVPKSFLPEYPYNQAAKSGRALRDERLAPFPRTERSVKVNRQEYYAIITHMDAQIGRILKSLEESGKADNTYIIFTADHGLAVGDHGFIGKQNMYDRSIRVPMFIVGPDIKAGTIINEKVYLQDAMATALDIAKSDALNKVDFRSLLPNKNGEFKNGHEAVYGAYLDAQRMIRTDEYKMIIYPKIDKVRLYNLMEDPEEIIDLAENSQYKQTMSELFEEFKKLQKEVEDELDITDNFNNFLATIK